MQEKCIGCSYCNNREIFYVRPSSGEKLCKKCYIKSIEKKVQNTISYYRMLRPNERIVIAVSGGKDSLSCLYILYNIEKKKFPDSKLIVVTIDEGINNYRSDSINIVKRNCKKLGLEHYVYSFKKIFGYNLDEIVINSNNFLSPCSYCGILRRQAINIAVKEIKATKLVTAHNLDDETQSIIMNFLRGDISKMVLNNRSREVESTRIIPRMKPLCLIPEIEILNYAILKKIEFQTTFCPYHESSIRSNVRKFLNELEEKHAGIKYNIFRSFEKLKTLEINKSSVRNCKICGFPSMQENCRTCNILINLGLKILT